VIGTKRESRWATSRAENLVKGIPFLHTGEEDLILGLISLETHTIDRLPGIPEAMGVSYTHVVAVPFRVMAKGRKTNDTSDGAAIREAEFLPSIPTALEGLVATAAYACCRARRL